MIDPYRRKDVNVRRQPNKYDILLPRLDSRVLETNMRRITEARRLDGVDAGDLQRDLRIGEAHLVTDVSQVSLRRAVNTIAGYFKREFRYDFNQYPIDRDSLNEREAWLWAANEHTNLRAIGAAVFCQDRYQAAPGSGRDWQWAWVLNFVWIHPYERGQGLLSASWDGWQTRYPGFVIEQPWSPTMVAFLERHPHTHYDGTSTSDLIAEHDSQRHLATHRRA